MSTQYKQPNLRKKNALDHRKLNLFTPCPAAPEKLATLIWGIFSNNPRLTVYTGDPSDNSEQNGYGRISANLDTPTFYAFIRLLEKVANSDKPMKDKIQNKNFAWINNQRAEHPTIVSNLWVGKETDGQVWIGVFADGRPEIKFHILPSDYHSFYHGETNTPFAAGEVSQLYALGYCDLLRNMVSDILVNDYVEDQVKSTGQQVGYMRPVSNAQNITQTQMASIPTGDVPF